MPDKKDQEIADLKERLAQAEKRGSDAEARLKKIEELMAKWDEQKKPKSGYPGSAYDLTRKPRGGPWGLGRRGLKYGIPF